jgi:hypothetical protein
MPALKRMIGVDTLFRSAQALLPPHECGGSHHDTPGTFCMIENCVLLPGQLAACGVIEFDIATCGIRVQFKRCVP